MDHILSPSLPSASAASTTWVHRIKLLSSNSYNYKELKSKQRKGLTTKRASTKEGLENIKWVVTTTSATHSFFERVLAILVIDLSFLWVTQNLVCLGQLFKLNYEKKWKRLEIDILRNYHQIYMFLKIKY